MYLRLLIADDHALIRQGLVPLLQQAFVGVEIDQAEDYEQVMTILEESSDYDLLLLDLNMPGHERGKKLHQLISRFDIACVVVSGLSSPDVIRQALDLKKVYAFIDKGVESEILIDAVRSSLAGESLGHVSPKQTASSDVVELPPRLQRVRKLLKQGLSNKEIARELSISEGTVKNYLTDMFKILKVNNRTQAAKKGEDFFT